MIVSSWSRIRGLPASPDQAEDEADDGEDQEQEEEDLRDAGGAGGDAAEAEQRGDERDDEKDDGVVQHFDSPRAVVCGWAPATWPTQRFACRTVQGGCPVLRRWGRECRDEQFEVGSASCRE